MEHRSARSDQHQGDVYVLKENSEPTEKIQVIQTPQKDYLKYIIMKSEWRLLNSGTERGKM